MRKERNEENLIRRNIQISMKQYFQVHFSISYQIRQIDFDLYTLSFTFKSVFKGLGLKKLPLSLQGLFYLYLSSGNFFNNHSSIAPVKTGAILLKSRLPSIFV